MREIRGPASEESEAFLLLSLPLYLSLSLSRRTDLVEKSGRGRVVRWTIAMRKLPEADGEPGYCARLSALFHPGSVLSDT